MNDEIRNELLCILSIGKSKTEKEKLFYFDWTLERFECDIKKKLEEIESQKKMLLDNLELVEHIKKELNIKK